MAFVDELTISAAAGKGGDGVVRWRQEKYIDRGGPWGGDGGKGGDVYLRAVRDVTLLSRYKANPSFRAEDGRPGMGGLKHGADGLDMYVDVPLGSRITDLVTGHSFFFEKEGEQQLVLRGGNGGLGNAHFKSSLNTTPTRATPGKAGDAASFKIEVELIADAGFVGLPNAGKSSLLNAITNADAKVGAYAFTTLEPNLGAFHGFILADIPGLIEGASEGKGLGATFLRHIKKTKVLVHLVSFENPDMMAAYDAIRAELSSYGQGLAEKPEVILLTKTDTADADTVAAKKQAFEKLGKPVFTASLYDDSSAKAFADELVKLLRK